MGLGWGDKTAGLPERAAGCFFYGGQMPGIGPFTPIKG